MLDNRKMLKVKYSNMVEDKQGKNYIIIVIIKQIRKLKINEEIVVLIPFQV